jgi:hypothetical protein
MQFKTKIYGQYWKFYTNKKNNLWYWRLLGEPRMTGGGFTTAKEALFTLKARLDLAVEKCRFEGTHTFGLLSFVRYPKTHNVLLVRTNRSRHYCRLEAFMEDGIWVTNAWNLDHLNRKLPHIKIQQQTTAKLWLQI